MSSPQVKTVFRQAEYAMKGHVLSENPYEDVDPRTKAAFLFDILTKAATDTNRMDIEERLREDDKYSNILIQAVSIDI